MDLNKLKPEEKVVLCKKYFFGGFAFLPFLWIVNSVWFFKDAFLTPSSFEQKQIRSYVIKSMIGGIICLSLIIGWVVFFQMHRVQWGKTADLMTYILPYGVP